MIRRKIRFANLAIYIGLGFVFAVFMIFLSPRYSFLGKLLSARDMVLLITHYSTFPELTYFHRAIFSLVIFIICVLSTRVVSFFAFNRIERIAYASSKTALFNSFKKQLHFCHTQVGLIEIVRSELEYKADCAVLILDSETKNVIYNSSSYIISQLETYDLILYRFSEEWSSHWVDGVYFFSEEMELVSSPKDARGFFISVENIRLFVVCRYLNDIEPSLFSILFEEFSSYLKREKTLGQLLYYSELSQEWEMVASTQMSFLPKKTLAIEDLDVGVFFRPLINVSGDYYDIIPIDKNKTLLVSGDISGKGLAAALVMGVVVNTIKIIDNKEDLPGIIYAIDMAIKRMGLQDKYTVLFLGLVDTEKMTIRYINASMESPMIFTKAAEGYKIKTLDSNCSVVGIIDMDDVAVTERSLYRGDLIVMVSDGISEVVDENGVELGSIDLFTDSIQSFAHKDATNIAEDIANMAFSYSVDNKVRDDITILAAKLKG